MARLLVALAVFVACFECDVARADLGDESLGINAHVPSNDLLDMTVDLGVGWIRVDANWAAS